MFRLALVVATTFLLGGGGIVCASEPTAVQPTMPPLTLRRAVDLALENNASLRALGAALDVERARGDALSLAPAYRLGAELENFAGTGETGGADNLESTLSLSGVFEMGDKRARRRHLAAASLEVVETEQHLRRLDLAATVARRYVDLVSIEALTSLRRDATVIATRTLETVRARVEAARASRAELAKAEIALARAELDQQATERALRSSRVALASLWGAQTLDFGATTADLYRLPPYEPFATLAARVEQNPDLVQLASQMRLEEARGRLANTARRADVGWTAGVRRLEGPGDQAFVVGIELPLGNAARAEPLRREAAAERGRLQLEADARGFELHATLFSAYEQLEQARTELTTLRGHSMSLAEEALRLTEQGYAGGRYSLLELIDAQAQLLEVRTLSIEAAADFHRLLTEIQRLTNEPVVETTSGE